MIQDKNIILCGKGRIGGKIAQIFDEKNIQYKSARIDSEKGLLSSVRGEMIDLLIICISAGHRREGSARWSWQDIFHGLEKQVINNDVVIKNVIMVSSTRVYEAYDNGIIDASSPTKTNTENGLAIQHAENILSKVSDSCRLLRCSGLYGESYKVYEPILKSGRDKPRFGVLVEVVIERLYQLTKDLLVGNFNSGNELLTDGYAYFEGKCLQWQADEKYIEELSQSFRILKKSIDDF